MATRSRDLAWVARLWAVVALFAAVALVRSHQVGISLRDPHGAIFVTRVGLSLGLFAVLVLGDTAVRVRRRHLPWRRLPALARQRWTWSRLVLALSGLLAYHVVYFCYHNLKSWDVLNRPRDRALLRWDQWLFLGHHPAVLLHDLLGERVAAYVLLVVYESFSTVVAVALVASVTLLPRLRDGYVYVSAAVCAWILGVASYYAIPSLGPFHSDPSEFRGLPHTMVQDTQARYLAQRAHLLAHPHAADVFAQVSAFASLHVAFVSLLWLMARYYGFRRLARGLAVFLVGTVLATVYLGWHFFVDDVAGLLIAATAVCLGHWIVYPRAGAPVLDRPRAARTSGSRDLTRTG